MFILLTLVLYTRSKFYILNLILDNMEKEFKVTPWEVSGKIDYDKLVREFGVSKIDSKISKRISKLHPLLRRGVYFSHSDFDKWISAHDSGKKVSVLTGRGPSE